MLEVVFITALKVDTLLLITTPAFHYFEHNRPGTGLNAGLFSNNFVVAIKRFSSLEV